MSGNSVETEQSAKQSSWGAIVVLAAQHVIVLFSGIVLVPVMLVTIHDFDQATGNYLIWATTVCAAASTLLQLVRYKQFGLGSPMFMGTSGAFMACAHAAIQMGGAPLLAGMVLVSAPFQMLFSYLIRFMRHIITPTVGGVIIMLAVVGLLKDSVVTWTAGGNLSGFDAFLDIGMGALTIAIMLSVEWFGGRTLRPWGLPLGILAGTLMAGVTGLSAPPDLASAPWVGMPQGEWPGFAFAADNGSHWMITFTFVLAVLATSVKYTGDAMILQKVADPDRKKVDYDALQGGLYANSIGMILAGLSGGMPSSSHSANIPLMGMTGVATRRVAAVASLMLAAVAFSPKMLLLLVSIPEPVIGGVGVVLVAHLFSSGMQLMASEMNHRNGLIAGLSLCAGLIAVSGNFFPAAFPESLAPLARNGVALGGIVAIISTLVTRLGTHRGIRISVVPTMENLVGFKRSVEQAAGKLGLDGHEAGYLELACEEVFLYMGEEYRSMGTETAIRFVLQRQDGAVKVEVSGGGRFASEADELAARRTHGLEAFTEEDLTALGLILLGRIASDVNHVTIAGYTYISFSLNSDA